MYEEWLEDSNIFHNTRCNLESSSINQSATWNVRIIKNCSKIEIFCIIAHERVLELKAVGLLGVGFPPLLPVDAVLPGHGGAFFVVNR